MWAENWPAVELFLKIQTQWISGPSGLIGLNYQSVEFVFKLYKTNKRKEVFEDLRDIEIGVLEAQSRMNEERRSSA